MPSKPVNDLIAQAEKAYHSGKFADAAGLFHQSALRCTEEGEALKAAELENNRSVALLQSGNAQAALEAAQGTEQVFFQAGDTRRQGLALGNQAAALDALGLSKEALDLYVKCADLLKQAGDKESRATVLKSISALQVRTGHQLEALASMNAALENEPKLSVKERFLKKLLKIPFDMMRR